MRAGNDTHTPNTTHHHHEHTPSCNAAPRVSKPWHKDLYDLRHRDATRSVAATCEEAAWDARGPSADVEVLTRRDDCDTYSYLLSYTDCCLLTRHW